MEIELRLSRLKAREDQTMSEACHLVVVLAVFVAYRRICQKEFWHSGRNTGEELVELNKVNRQKEGNTQDEGKTVFYYLFIIIIIIILQRIEPKQLGTPYTDCTASCIVLAPSPTVTSS